MARAWQTPAWAGGPFVLAALRARRLLRAAAGACGVARAGHPAPHPAAERTPPAVTPSPRTLTVHGVGDLLAFVATRLGYHPAESLAVVGLRGHAGTGHPLVGYTVLFDLPPDRGYLADSALFVEPVAAVFDRYQQDGVILLGYGPGTRVTPVIDAVRAVTAVRGIAVHDAVRVEAGRYWSYQCDGPGCCPPEGRPYDLSSSAITAAAVVDGVRVLPSRRDLADTLAPQSGPAAAAMRAATDEARRWMTALSCHAVAGQGRPAGAAVVDLAVEMVTVAVEAYQQGGRASDRRAARITVLLGDTRARNAVVALIARAGDHLDGHLALWTDLTRRAEANRAACATLLAVTTWSAGNTVRGIIAAEQALAADPDYTLAALVLTALRSGAPARILRQILDQG